ncbi:hypothetical protein like AT3G13130 [Hibiscus trionum]|uniref:Uncharacterized protein n=1 Tax=Hibiscus trionum TaxID=183268 RepID=A0A9W7LRG9_HIBTR|nr:hypothetical protein like AT3G13130 [Hibiscus trionum]
MDEYEKHADAETKLQAAGKYQFLKNTLQIVISVAFLSIFLSHSSGFAYSLFPHSFHVYFSTFLFSFFTHTLERKYMFLICNGILAFIAKTSISSLSTSSASLTETKALEVDGGEYDIHRLPSVAEEHEDICRDEVEARREYENGSLSEEEEEEGGGEESEASVVVEDDVDGGEEDKEKEEQWSAAKQEEVPISISTEELNRKIEEFIRKMKEEIRIEAQQQQMIASN